MNTAAVAGVTAVGLRVDAGQRSLLREVSFTAAGGELVGLVGPNGAGKSTLLRTVAGLTQRSRGTVRIFGVDLDSLSRRQVAARLAFVAQQEPQTGGFSSRQIVSMGRFPHLRRFQPETARDHAIVDGALRTVGATSFADRDVGTLSGGERRRVFLARALAQQPSVLLLDEPIANLDVCHQIRFLDLVLRLVGRGTTVVIALHDLTLAARYCHRLVLLQDGDMAGEGAPEMVLTREILADVFGVVGTTYKDQHTGRLAVSIHEAVGA